MTGRIRSLLAASAVAAVLFYGLSGHGLPHASHDGMLGAAAGLCLLLVTALRYAAVPEPERTHPTVLTAAVPIAVATPLPALPDAGARASPSALQRFRN
jgi:hypothetical protein